MIAPSACLTCRNARTSTCTTQNLLGNLDDSKFGMAERRRTRLELWLTQQTNLDVSNSKLGRLKTWTTRQSNTENFQQLPKMNCIEEMCNKPRNDYRHCKSRMTINKSAILQSAISVDASTTSHLHSATYLRSSNRWFSRITKKEKKEKRRFFRPRVRNNCHRLLNIINQYIVYTVISRIIVRKYKYNIIQYGLGYQEHPTNVILHCNIIQIHPTL